MAGCNYDSIVFKRTNMRKYSFLIILAVAAATTTFYELNGRSGKTRGSGYGGGGSHRGSTSYQSRDLALRQYYQQYYQARMADLGGRYNNQWRQRTQWPTTPSYPSYQQYPVQPVMQQQRPWYKFW
jgi:hypothetical protein